MTETVFLDRDGTINVKAPEGDYVKSWDEFEFLPGAVDAIRALHGSGRRVVVVTNQRGIALDRMSEADLADIHARMLDAIGPGVVTAVYHCPHDEGECDCRKPRPGMLLRAAADLPDLDLRQATLIGDSDTDVEAGRAVGANVIKIGDDPPSLAEAVRWLLAS